MFEYIMKIMLFGDNLQSSSADQEWYQSKVTSGSQNASAMHNLAKW